MSQVAKNPEKYVTTFPSASSIKAARLPASTDIFNSRGVVALGLHPSVIIKVFLFSTVKDHHGDLLKTNNAQPT